MMKMHDNGETCQRESFALLFFAFFEQLASNAKQLGLCGVD